MFNKLFQKTLLSLQHFVLAESVMKLCKTSATEIVHLSHLSSCRVAIVALQPSCFEQYQRDVIHKKNTFKVLMLKQHL